jgi:peptide methionine sulfoxide reductase MsrB
MAQDKSPDNLQVNEDWQQKLTADQYRVTRLGGTEAPLSE